MQDRGEIVAGHERVAVLSAEFRQKKLVGPSQLEFGGLVFRKRSVRFANRASDKRFDLGLVLERTANILSPLIKRLANRNLMAQGLCRNHSGQHRLKELADRERLLTFGLSTFKRVLSRDSPVLGDLSKRLGFGARF